MGLMSDKRPAIACILAAAILPAAAASTAENSPALCADEIVARMIQSEQSRERSLTEYSATRQYTLRGENGKTAAMTVRLVYRSASGKSFEVLSKGGADGIFGHVLDKVLEAETETSRRHGELISPANYDFRLLGLDQQDGRRCYMLQLLPKHKSKYLIDGKAWIDAEDFALVRLEGRTAGSVSFWIGRPYITQSFEKVGNYWLASKNDSVANAKFFGRTELTIQSSDYSVPGLEHEQVAQRYGSYAPSSARASAP